MTMWTPDLSDEGTPRYIAIAEAIARDVESGRLVEGEKLPTHRQLAERLDVTVGTVTRGYAEAERRGLTVGEVGRGTFVRPRHEPEEFSWPDAATARDERDTINMSLAYPWIPPDGEEGKLLGRTLEQVARSGNLDVLMGYDPTTGLPHHRVVAAKWIGAMGLDVSADQVVVTSGAQHAISVCLATLLRPGDTVATAELTYPGIKSVAHMLGLELHGIRMDDEGIVPEALDEACTRAPIRALYCVPTIQNPTSATLSELRRREIAEIARKHGLIIVEDQIHVTLEKERIPPIALFAPERTLHITTLCKWATFGLRIGFIAAPESVVERLRSGVRASLWMPAPLMAEIAARWISDGTAAHLAQRKVRELEARQALVRDILGERFPVQAHPRSLHCWVGLPDPMRSDECVAKARQRGVLIAGAEAFAVGREVPHAVRISISAVPERAGVRHGLEIVGEILEGSPEPWSQIV